MKISKTMASAQAQLIADALAGGMLRFYSGVPVLEPDDPLSGQVLLAECGIPTPAGTVQDGVLTFGAIIADASANAGGTPTWVRGDKADGTPVLLGKVGEDGDLTGEQLTFPAGSRVAITGLVYVVSRGS